MTLDEAIAHAREVAKEKRNDYERACALNVPSEGFCKCSAEHEQLADWLEELKARREAEKARPKGVWIDRMADKGYAECPFCHKQITGGDLNFCVKCGADMRKGGAE